MRRALKIFGTLILLLAVGVIALLALLPSEKIAQLAADQVKSATGRTLVISGDVSPSFYPVIGVETGAVTLSNAEWGTAENMVTASGTKIGVELLPLLSGEIRVSEVRLVDPVIALEVNEDGAANWVFETGAPAEDPTPEASASTDSFVKDISLGEAVIENGAVSFTDRSTGQDINLDAINASIALEALDAPLEVDGTARWNGEETALNLFMATPAAAIAGAEIELRLDLDAAPVSARFDGTILPPAPDRALAANGDFAVAAADPGGAITWATGQPAPAQLVGITDLKAEGRADVSPTGVAVDITGGATRDGQAATIALKADGDANFAENQALTIDLNAVIGDIAALTYQGTVAPSEGPVPVILTGTFDISAANPAEVMTWATGQPAPPALAGITDLAAEGSADVSPSGAAIDITGGATRDGQTAAIALKANGAGDFASNPVLDVDLNAKVGQNAALTYVGTVAPSAGAVPVALTGDYDLSAADPAGLMRWATGSAPEGVVGLSALALAGAIDLGDKGLAASAKGGVSRDGAKAVVDLTAKSGADWATRRAFTVAVNGGIDGLADLSFDGNVAAPEGGAPSANGTLSLNAPDLKRLAAFAGASLPQAGPSAYRSLSLAGTLSLPSPQQITFTADRLQFDDIQASGKVTASLGETPNVNANLSTGALDLTPYIVGQESGPSGPGWSKERIDLSALGSLNGDFAIRAASVILPQLQLGTSDLSAKLRNGRLDLKIRELGLYGGGLQGDIAVDGRNNNSIKANVSASAVRLLPMLKAVADIDNIEGTGKFKMNVAGGGASLHDIMNSLNGNGNVKLKKGALVGYNLAAMVRNVTSAFTGDQDKSAKTDFSEIAATFDIKQGVLSNADFSFLGPLLRIVGQGTVDLGGQAVNFRLTPKAVASLKGQGGSLDTKGLSFPVLITGPWSDLSFRPDLQGGIENLLKDPEGAAEALGGIVDSISSGGAAGAASDVLKNATGGAATGAATKALKEATGGNPEVGKAIDQLIGGGKKKKDFGPLIKAAKQDLEDAKASGDKKQIKKAKKKLKRLRDQRKAQNNPDPVGGLLKKLSNN